jgi:predicted transposase YbfD/YdcC
VLGQIKVDEKSNQITAIPELLEILCVENCVVTIDAMGCQRDIAEKITKNDTNYILAVKGNQQELHQDIKDSFVFSKKVETVTDVDFGHGRIETRTCSVIKDLSRIRKYQRWENLSSLVKVESTREFKNSTKPTETFIRYFISSCDQTEVFFQQSIRSHWAIENKLHWLLDVAFGEYASRKRKGNAAQNYSLLLKMALNLLKNEKTEKQGIKGKRLKAAWDVWCLKKVMKIKV